MLSYIHKFSPLMQYLYIITIDIDLYKLVAIILFITEGSHKLFIRLVLNNSLSNFRYIYIISKRQNLKF